MADVSSNATFTVTAEGGGKFSFSPDKHGVITGGTVTLIADGASSISIVALLADGQPYEPLGPTPYEAIPSPGKAYTLAPGELQTGFLSVENERTDPPGQLVPVQPMAVTPDRFDPEEIDVLPGGEIRLTLTGGGAETTVETFDANGDAFALFGGRGNSYPVPSGGITYTVVDDADGLYGIEAPPGEPQVPVKGTINVKRPTNTPKP